MAFFEVYRYRNTFSIDANPWDDYLGNPAVLQPIVDRQMASGLFYPGWSLPDLSWEGPGECSYLEIWEGDLTATRAGFATTNMGTTDPNAYFEVGHQLSTGLGGTVPGFDQQFFTRANPFRVTVVVTTPTGVYNYTYTQTNPNLIPNFPSRGDLIAGGDFTSKGSGVMVPGTPFTWYEHTTVSRLERTHWGSTPTLPSNTITVDGATSGRYVKITIGSCFTESEVCSGDPYAGGAGADTVQVLHSITWVDAWSLRFKFDLVDHLGSPISKRVIFSKGYRQNLGSGSVSHFEEKTGSFDQTVSYGTQVDFNEGEYISAGGSGVISWSTAADVILPFGIGVIVPQSTYEEESPPADALNIQWNDTERISRPWGALLTYQNKPGWVPVKAPSVFDRNNYTLSLPSVQDMDHQPDSWSTVPGGSVSGDTLTATSGTPIFTAAIPTPHTAFWNMYPYRWFKFDYTAENAGSVDVIIRQQTGSGFLEKLYTIRVQAGSHTAYVDTCNPKKYATLGTGYQPISDLPRIDGQNVAVANPLRYSDGRFGGIAVITGLALRFADNEITVTDFGGEIRYRAKGRKMPPLFSYDPFVLSGSLGQNSLEMVPFYSYVGDVDGKDAHRFQIVPAVNSPTALPSSGTSFNYDYSVLAYSQNTITFQHAAAVQRDGTLYPEVDFVAGFTDNDGFYSYGCGTVPGIQHTSLFGGAPFYHASMFWGTGLAATTIRQTEAHLVNQTVDGTSFTEDIDISTPEATKGWGLGKLGWWWSPNASALNWQGEAPNDGGRHFRLRDRTQPIPYDWRTRTGALSIGSVYWVGLLGISTDLSNTLSYCVSSALRHFRASIQEGTVWIGKTDNQLDPDSWIDTDTGIEAQSLCLTVEKRAKTPKLFLYTGNEAGEIERRQSSDEGASWDMATQISTSGTAKSPAVVIGANGNHYVYWIDSEEVKGAIFDAALEEREPEFTAVSPVDEVGLAAAESAAQGGVQRIGLAVVQSGDIILYKGNSGRNFS